MNPDAPAFPNHPLHTHSAGNRGLTVRQYIVIEMARAVASSMTWGEQAFDAELRAQSRFVSIASRHLADALIEELNRPKP